MPIRPKAMAIRTIPRQLKFGSLLRLLSRWELRSGCAISFGARTLAALEKLHQQMGNAMSRSHAFGIRHQIGGGVRLGDMWNLADRGQGARGPHSQDGCATHRAKG